VRIARVTRLAAELEVDANLAPGLREALEDQLSALLAVLGPEVLLLIDSCVGGKEEGSVN
jgi:hypothetical protein